MHSFRALRVSALLGARLTGSTEGRKAKRTKIPLSPTLCRGSLPFRPSVSVHYGQDFFFAEDQEGFPVQDHLGTGATKQDPIAFADLELGPGTVR
jgi:hypothetical protein